MYGIPNQYQLQELLVFPPKMLQNSADIYDYSFQKASTLASLLADVNSLTLSFHY